MEGWCPKQIAGETSQRPQVDDWTPPAPAAAAGGVPSRLRHGGRQILPQHHQPWGGRALEALQAGCARARQWIVFHCRSSGSTATSLMDQVLQLSCCSSPAQHAASNGVCSTLTDFLSNFNAQGTREGSIPTFIDILFTRSVVRFGWPKCRFLTKLPGRLVENTVH